MAKKSDKLSFSEFAASLQSSNLKMNPAHAAILEAAQAEVQASIKENKPVTTPKTKSDYTLLNKNIVKLIKTIELNTTALSKKSEVNKSVNIQSADLTEREIEIDKVNARQIRLLEKIEENTRNFGQKSEEKKEELPKFKIGIGKLSALSTLTVLSLGISFGAIKAYTKMLWNITKTIGEAVKDFTSLITPKYIKDLGPRFVKFVKNTYDILTINVTHAFGSFKEFFKNRFPKQVASLEKAIISISNFAKAIQSKIITAFKVVTGVINSIKISVVSTFNKFRLAVSNFFAPFRQAIALFSKSGSSFSIVSKITGFFNTVASKLSIIGKVFSVGKSIGARLPVINQIIGGIVGLFDGFKEYKKTGSLLKAAGAFSKGAFKFMIGDLLDLVKNGLAWVSGKLGFDKIKKSLDSFSFVTTYNKFVDYMVDLYEKIWEFFKHPIDSIRKFLGLTPVDGKETKVEGASKTTPAMNKDPEFSKIFSKNVISPVNTGDKVQKYNQQIDSVKDKKSVPLTSPTVVNTQQVNNQTQNAFMKTSIRNNDSTHNRYLNSVFNI